MIVSGPLCARCLPMPLIVSHAHRRVLLPLRWQPFRYRQVANRQCADGEASGHHHRGWGVHVTCLHTGKITSRLSSSITFNKLLFQTHLCVPKNSRMHHNKPCYSFAWGKRWHAGVAGTGLTCLCLNRAFTLTPTYRRHNRGQKGIEPGEAHPGCYVKVTWKNMRSALAFSVVGYLRAVTSHIYLPSVSTL